MNTTDTIKLKIEVREDGSYVITNLNEKIKQSSGSFESLGKKSGVLSGAVKSLWAQFAVGNLAAKTLTTGLQALKDMIRSIINSAIDFEKEFANVTTLLSGSSAAAVEEMRGSLFAMAGDLGSTIELTRGLYQTLSAGIAPGAEAMKFLETSAKFAKAGLVDMTASVDVLSTVINAYGLNVKDVTEVSDILFQTVKDGKLTGEELASSLGKVIPTAATLKIDLREVAAAMAVLTKGGTKAFEAVTSLNGILMAVIKPTEEATRKAAELGIEFSKAGIEGAGGLQKWLADLKEKVGENEAALGELFPRVEGLRSVFALVGAQAKEYSDEMERMKNVAGNTEEAFQKQISTFDGATTAIKNMVESAFQQALLPALQSLASWVRDNKDTILGFFQGMLNFLTACVDAIDILWDSWSNIPDIAGGGLMMKALAKEAENLAASQRRGAEATQRFIASGFGVTNLLDQMAKGYKEVEKFMAGYLKNVIDGTRYTNEEKQTIEGLQQKIKDLKHEMFGYTEYSESAQNKIKELNQEIEKLIKLRDIKPRVVEIPDMQTEPVDAYQKAVADAEKTLEEFAKSGANSAKAVKTLSEELDPATKGMIDTKLKTEELKQAIIDTARAAREIGGALLNAFSSLGIIEDDLAKKIGNVLNSATSAAAQFASGDIIGGIASSINLIAGLFDLFEKADPVEEALENWNELLDEGKEGTYEMWEFLHREYALLGEELEEIQEYQAEKINAGIKALSSYYAYAATSQERFNRAQIYTVAMFAGLIAQGYTFIDAIRTMEKQLNELLDIVKSTGYEVNESLKFMLDITDFIKQNEDLANALSATGQILDTIFESGIYNLSQLQAIIYTTGSDLADMFYEAIGRGASREEAWAMIIPTLNDLIYYAMEYGLKIDEQTQALIDQAKAEGYLSEIQIPAVEKQVMLLEEIVRCLGGDIPYILDEIADNTKNWVSDAHQDWDDKPDKIVPKFGSGGEFWTDRSQMIEVGEGNEIEHVKITPRSQYSIQDGNMMGFRQIVMHFAGGIVVYGASDPEKFKDNVAEALIDVLERDTKGVSNKIYELSGAA